jgi:hypothetical protein
MLADRLLGCPALPDRPLLPDTRPGRRLPGSPAVSRSFPRERYPVQIPVRSASRPALQPFPEVIPETVSGPDTRPKRRLPGSSAVSGVASRIGTCYQVPVRGAGCPTPQPFPELPPEWYLFPGYPSGMPVARLPGRSRSFPRERYPSLAVMNFYSLDLTRHKSFPAAISRFFSHPQDTRSYPPRPAVFPPRYPQIRPQTVEFRGLGRLGTWAGRGRLPGPGPALPRRGLSRRRRRWGTIRRLGIRRCHGTRRCHGSRRTAAARCRPRSRPLRAPRR